MDMLSKIDTSVLMLSLVVSTVGFGYFTYGRKTQAFPFMISGAIMMFYGYFVDSFWLALIIGAVLAGIPFVWR